MGYWTERLLFGKDIADTNFEYRMTFNAICTIAIALLVLVIATGYGIVYVAICLWREVTIQLDFKRRYGADWKSEFERYYGSLAHAQTRLIIVLVCLIALAVILGWVARRTYRIHKRKKFDGVY